MANAGRLTVLLEATTVDFTRGMAQAEGTVNRFNTHVTGSGRGLAIMETGLRRLGFEAVGLKGPLGKVAEGLALFGGGSTLVLGVAAGLGAIALAMKLMGQEAEETQKRVEGLIKMARGGGFGAETAQKPLEAQLGQLQIDLDEKVNGRFDLFTKTWTMVPKLVGDARSKVELEAQGIIAALQAIQEQANETALAMIAGMGGGAAAVIAQRTARTSRLLDFAKGGAGVGGSLLGQETFSGAAAARGIDFLTGMKRSPLTDARLRRIQLGAEDRPGTKPPGMSTADWLGVAGGGIQLLNAAAGGGGNRAGNFLMGAGGAIGSIPGGQLAGGIVGLGGALVNVLGGLFGHKGEDPAVIELRKANATLQQQLKIAQDEKNFRGVIVVKAGTFDENDPDAIDRLVSAIRNADDRRIELEGRKAA